MNYSSYRPLKPIESLEMIKIITSDLYFELGDRNLEIKFSSFLGKLLCTC